MQVERVTITKLKANPSNPRSITEEKYRKLVQSLQEFPEMLELRPLVVDDSYMVLGGNMRLRALKELGHKQVTIFKASGLTDAQKQEFLVKDNISSGSHDFDMLSVDFELEQLEAWGLDVPGLELKAEEIDEDALTEESPKCPECGK